MAAMLGLGLGFPAGRAAGGSAEPPIPLHDPATTALLGRMTGSYTDADKAMIDSTVLGLKAAGIWDRLDTFQVFAAANAADALLNWKGAVFGGTNNGATWTAAGGFVTNGTSTFLDTGFNASLGAQYTQNDCSYWAYCGATGTQTVGNLANGNDTIFLNPRTTTDQVIARAQSVTNITWAPGITNGQHFAGVSRTGATASQIHRNGVQRFAAAEASAALHNSTVTLGRRPSNGTFAAQTFLMFAAGGALTALQAKQLNMLVQRYLLYRGWLPTSLAFGDHAAVAYASRVVLPDGAFPVAPGVGFPSTGLAFDASDGTFWAGHGTATASANAGVVQLDAARATVLRQVTVGALGLASGSAQGVAVDTADGTIWFVNKIPGGAGSNIVNITRTGTLISSTPSPAGATTNGLAYDSTRNQLVALTDAGVVSWIDKATMTLTGKTFTTSITGIDMLFYDAAFDLLYLSHGTNGANGQVTRLYPGYSATAAWRIDTTTLTESQAIEGIALDAARVLHVLNDGHTHPEGVYDFNAAYVYAAYS